MNELVHTMANSSKMPGSKTVTFQLVAIKEPSIILSREF